LLAITTPATAQPPDIVFEFVVQNDSLEELLCSSLQPGQPIPPGFNCDLKEGPAPYKLATLTLTHAALTSHKAQRIFGEPSPVDERNVVTLAMASPGYGPGVPFNTIPGLQGWTVDLTLRGGHVSGEIGVSATHPTGSQGCALDMKGSNNNWAGTWRCGSPSNPATFLHSFTAISTRVGGQVAQK